MSLEREDMNKCVACGRLVDGDVCDQYCEARADEMLREKEIARREARHAELVRNRAARKAQLSNILGPK